MKNKLPGAGTSIFATMTALANQHQAINLAQGFPNFDPPLRLRELVAKAMQDGFNQYAPMTGWPDLRERLVHKINMTYGYRPDPFSEITITAGATQGIFCAIQATIHPGDEVILLEPAYDCYLPAVLLAGGIPRPVPLLPPLFRPDWDRIRDTISSKTRMIIINNPHNPTGTILHQEDLDALKSLVLEHQLILISDEVYEHLVFDGKKHLSVLRDPDLFAHSMVTFSFGKTFHATGWKTGYIVAPAALTTEYRKVHQFEVFSVNTPSQVGLAAFMEDESSWSGLADFYQEKRDFFFDAIKDSPLKPLPCSGTYFGLLDYSALSQEDDRTFCRQFTERCGVAFIPISPFYQEAPINSRVARVCFAKTEALLSEAAQRIQEGNY